MAQPHVAPPNMPWQNAADNNGIPDCLMTTLISFEAFVHAASLEVFFYFTTPKGCYVRGTHSRTSKIIAEPVRLLNCGAEVAGPWLLFWLQNVDNLTTSAAHNTFAQRRWNFHGTRLQMLKGILTKKRLIRNPHHDGKFKVRIRGVVENRVRGH